MISEKTELLGKGLYKAIPDELTLHSIPTASELDYVGAEDLDRVMLESVIPNSIDEKFNPYDLLEIDYQWICRCLRLLSYGPYFTTNAIYCGDCGKISTGEYQVNLSSVDCVPLPEGFTNELKITKDEFIEFGEDIIIKLLTIGQVLTARKDKLFKDSDGETKTSLSRICYMISSIGNNNAITPIEVKHKIENEMISADFRILMHKVDEMTNYGLRIGGKTQCPKCKSFDASFFALVDDKFFRPTMGDLQRWGADRRSERKNQNIS